MNSRRALNKRNAPDAPLDIAYMFTAKDVLGRLSACLSQSGGRKRPEARGAFVAVRSSFANCRKGRDKRPAIPY